MVDVGEKEYIAPWCGECIDKTGRLNDVNCCSATILAK